MCGERDGDGEGMGSDVRYGWDWEGDFCIALLRGQPSEFGALALIREGEGKG